MGVRLTEKAAKEVLRSFEEQKFAAADTFLRVLVTGGGCSGFSYKLALDKQFNPDADMKADFHGVSVLVDKKSDLMLDGTTIDYHDGLEARGFTFENPNAVKTCGCGSSFSA
jgi:iron-sulfur cluster assembly protein